jgi:hypothetical protein
VATNINTGAGNANSTVRIENNIAKACYRTLEGLAFVTDRADVLAGLLEALGDENVNLDTFMQSIGVGGGIFQFGSTLTVGGTGVRFLARTEVLLITEATKNQFSILPPGAKSARA